MPLLDIAISHPCSGNKRLACWSETLVDNKLVSRYDKGLGLVSTFSWRTCGLKEKVGKSFNFWGAEAWRGGLRIKAVATLEIANVTPKRVKGNHDVLRMDGDSVWSNSSNFEPSSEDSTEVDEREKLRRMRISKANKGNTPWNKGKKHSPETLQLIKVRTRLAMQDPKIKMKLVNFGHAQSKETRVKIGVGVRLGWQRRREKLMLQETCHYEWQNLIALAAKNGLQGGEGLQWNSYKILSEKIEQEWLQSVEQRKNTLRPKGSKRAPKSAEQKRKISEAITAKWADPEYRNRVCSGLAKYHGIPEGVERNLRRKKPSRDGQTRKRSHRKKDETDDSTKCETKSQVQSTRPTRSKTPAYKDPLASSKLEMLKNIRAQRGAAMNKKTEAIFTAKLLIAEAEKAAEALESAAKKSPLARASLAESRMLLAEAMHLIESIENEDTILSQNNNDPQGNSTQQMDADPQTLEAFKQRKVNGVHVSPDGLIDTNAFTFNELLSPHLLNGNAARKPYPNGTSANIKNRAGFSSDNAQGNVVKKWVRGRLIEVAEED